MNKQPPSTQEIFNQLGTRRPFTEGRGRLDPFTPAELAQHEQDKARAVQEEAARWAANTALLAQQRQQAAERIANVIDISAAPSYREADVPAASEATQRQA